MKLKGNFQSTQDFWGPFVFAPFRFICVFLSSALELFQLFEVLGSEMLPERRRRWKSSGDLVSFRHRNSSIRPKRLFLAFKTRVVQVRFKSRDCPRFKGTT